ncbi:hypothetical protein [Pseudomonas silesiensis]|uniref:hypothetical protein n=1 Tax=Pseudomonas silesiensis TaxID=1853130 RepID=UPI000A712FC9|nr:hypothetical protein [Pseudomonas silesiensis]VVP28498.1 hypothetical protein PS874_04085 [Pseudomonas fluorescens]
MHGAIRAAGFSLMTMFVSCGVGAQDPGNPSSTRFTATAQVASDQWKMPLLTPVNP